MTTENKKRLIKLSASAAKTYEQCPRKYYFNYIERAPRKQWDHFDLGNVCHKTLEIFHEIYMKDGLKTYKTLNQLMGHAFLMARKGFPNMSDSMLADAKNMLMEYLNKTKKDGMPMVKGVETSFSFNVGEGLLLRGFLDRIDVLKDGQFKIIDYKTTKNEKYLDEFQLLIYGMWLKREYPHVKSFKGAYILLRHGSKLKEYDFNLEDVDKVEKKLLVYSEKIRNETLWTPIPTALCNWCDFKEICPANSSW